MTPGRLVWACLNPACRIQHDYRWFLERSAGVMACALCRGTQFQLRRTGDVVTPGELTRPVDATPLRRP